MKNKLFLTYILSLSLIAFALGQPNWPLIKSTTTLQVGLPAEFGAPYKQPLSVGGWEDGVFISRDGLNLYCFYTPIDLFSWQFVGAANNASFTPYFRGPSFGMDLITAPLPGPTEWLQSDILISQRAATTAPFPTWQLSGLANSIWSEGAPQINSITSSTADLFVYATNNVPTAYKTDIVLLRNVGLNPAIQGNALPAPVNTPNTREDNPHIERLSSQNLVLFWDSDDRAGGVGQLDIWFSTSTDNGITWATPTQVSTINTALGDQQPHLYNEGIDWYLYYTGTNTVTSKPEIYRAKQTISGNWNSWGNKQLVVGAGNAFGVGEPTLTQSGDLSFVVLYADLVNGTATDKYDSDPWFLPHIATSTVTAITKHENSVDFFVSPNPASTEVSISVGKVNEPQTIQFFNSLGELKKEVIINELNKIEITDLQAGIYFISIKNNPSSIKKIIKLNP